MSLLAVENLDVRHGLLQAVRGVSFTVARGETVALVGANGAGKTTLLRAIAGAHPVAGGRVLFNGAEVTRTSAHQRVGRGIALVPEGRRLFAKMSVEENLLLAQAAGRGGRLDDRGGDGGLSQSQARRHARAGTLSGGEQQATAIGRALMTNPELLMLDEVSLGLSPLAVDRVYASLQTLLTSGTTIILVEQDLSARFARRGPGDLHAGGRIALEGRAAALTREAVTEAYFGLRRGVAAGAAR